MSRIGRKPIPLPAGVTAEVQGQEIRVKGPRGELARTVHREMGLKLVDGAIVVSRPSDESRHKALHGLTRTLIANMVEGVARGYQKVLEIQGVGYKAEPTKSGLNVVVGLSHPVAFPAPEGITFKVENNTLVRVSGADKELVGQVAAELRQVRPPEPYKGKGIRYQGERVRRKAGKTGAK
jgi:large subunit ribosomal protein L6